MEQGIEREKLGSRLGFLLLSAGCAIGLGNVWRFPFITGAYGGAAFVLIYLVFLVILGLPIMILVMRSTPLCNPMEQTRNPATTVTAIQPT